MTGLELELFLICAPGLESVLAEEARDLSFTVGDTVPGGVTLRGDWDAVWRANLELRGATRVLVRLGSFPVFHLAQLDKRARKFPWGDVLPSDVPVRVDVTCRKSKIYHAGAATQRIETAIAETLGAPIDPKATLVLKVRIESNLCTISLDTSGDSLHRRGHKQATGKAPMRETLAALFLRACGYRGDEPVLDPMCGSGTFPIEAAEIAAGMQAGRSRGFAFEEFANFDATRRAGMRRDVTASGPVRFHGSDRDAGAVANAQANADRAGVTAMTHFRHAAVSDLTRPDGPTGLVIGNPPYGGAVWHKKIPFAPCGPPGQVLKRGVFGGGLGLR
ncbi:MAG: class I SAM-dependent RNA methyltransferase, partial [Paracoccaceae bacterium]